MRDPGMFEDPLCAQVGGDFWFPEVGADSIGNVAIATAKSICSQCTHRTECAEWGIRNESFGIWGGLTSRELSATRSKRNIKKREHFIA